MNDIKWFHTACAVKSKSPKVRMSQIKKLKQALQVEENFSNQYLILGLPETTERDVWCQFILFLGCFF